MNWPLTTIWLSSFASALASRITDPVLPQIAADLRVDVHSAALLATAFALPWALAQPVLGPLGDLLGKSRVIMVGLVVLTASAFIGAFATSFPVLFGSRVIAGISAAAVSPVAFALAADLLAPAERQIGIGRLLFASISGQLVGMVGAGLLGDVSGWRGVLLVSGVVVAATALVAPFGFRNVPERRADKVEVSAAMANYRRIFANPRAKFCYWAVFFEGITIHGLLPYVSPLLAERGETRSTIAGAVIAGFAIGGAIYAASVKRLLARFSQRRMMRAGGAFAAIALLAMGLISPWPLQALALCGMGFGFFMLHNCIQAQMLELVPDARGSAVAMHAFALFIGQAAGPILYGLAFPRIGVLPATAIGAVIMLGVGFVCARYLASGRAPLASRRSG